jgi:hypothetical protein
MRMREGERWHCTNPNCRCEILVTVAGGQEGHTNPTCCCGALMKKPYKPPVLRRIEKHEELAQIEIPIPPRRYG